MSTYGSFDVESTEEKERQALKRKCCGGGFFQGVYQPSMKFVGNEKGKDTRDGTGSINRLIEKTTRK